MMMVLPRSLLAFLLLLPVALGADAVLSLPAWSRQWSIAVPSVLLASLLAYTLLKNASTQNIPDTPPLVDNWLPWLGHIFSYGTTPAAFLKACREKYGPTYKFRIGGTYMVVLGTPATIASHLSNPSKSLELIDYQMTATITGFPNASKRMPIIYPFVEHKAMNAIGHGLNKSHFSPAALAFNRDLWARLVRGDAMGLKPGDMKTTARVNLLRLSQRAIFESNCVSLYGPSFPVEVFDEFITADDAMPDILKRIPFTARRGIQAREYVVKRLSEYVGKVWQEDEGRLEGVSDAISDTYLELTKGMTHSEATRVLFGFFWGTHSNHVKAAFWLMAYILTNPALRTRVSKEVEAAMGPGGLFEDVGVLLDAHPDKLDGREFAGLTSVMFEVMRVTTLPGSFRIALEDTTILGEEGERVFIRKGEFVIADTRGMHMNPEIYEEPEVFKAERFLDGEGNVKWPNDKTFSVFGGGSHACRGRYFAIHTIRMFVILCFHLFDMEVISVDGSRVELPRPDPKSLTPVVRTNDALWISMRRRIAVEQ